MEFETETLSTTPAADGSYNEKAIKAGTIIIIITTESIIAIGRRSFVPASSPLFLAFALRSSNAYP